MHKGFILVYDIDEYADCGGGTFCEFAESDMEMLELINKLNDIHGGRKFKVTFCGEIKCEIVVKPVERITKYEIEE